jgi:hypothetical protein
MSDDIAPPREPRKRDGLVIWQSEVRRTVKAIGLHNSEYAVCIAMLNHYWAINKDKNSARGLGHKVVPVYPGLAKIARKAGVSLRSCKRASSLLQKLNIIKVVAFKKGGRGSSQRFTINFQEIYACNGLERSDVAALRPARKGCHKGCHKGDTVAHGFNSVINEEKPSHENVIVFDPARRNPKGRTL